jgi:hypothetical protein
MTFSFTQEIYIIAKILLIKSSYGPILYSHLIILFFTREILNFVA